jgi:hypothetical protein
MRRTVLALPLAAILAGCGSQTLIPDEKLAISPNFQPSVEGVIYTVLAGVVAYYVIEPTAPNWEVKAEQIDDTRVAISLRKKRFSAGGDGEARDLFQRKAQALADDNGFQGFTVISYGEGIDSETTYARRVSRGVVRLVGPQQAPRTEG